jgi:hypothetical protein
VALANDEHPVGALSAYGAHPAFCERVRSGRLWRRLDHFEAFPGEHRVEDSGEFAISVAKQEPGPGRPLVEAHQHVSCLLGNPCAGRMRGDADDMDPAGGEFHEEQNVDPFEEHRVDGEEVAPMWVGLVKVLLRPGVWPGGWPGGGGRCGFSWARRGGRTVAGEARRSGWCFGGGRVVGWYASVSEVVSQAPIRRRGGAHDRGVRGPGCSVRPTVVLQTHAISRARPVLVTFLLVVVLVVVLVVSWLLSWSLKPHPLPCRRPGRWPWRVR